MDIKLSMGSVSCCCFRDAPTIYPSSFTNPQLSSSLQRTTFTPITLITLTEFTTVHQQTMEKPTVYSQGAIKNEPQRSTTTNCKQKPKQKKKPAKAAAAANQNATPAVKTAQDGDQTTLVNNTASRMSQKTKTESGPAKSGAKTTCVVTTTGPTASATSFEDCLEGPEVEVYHNTATGRELVGIIKLRLFKYLSGAAKTAFDSSPAPTGAGPDQYVISTTSNTAFGLKAILTWMKGCAAVGKVMPLSAFPREGSVPAVASEQRSISLLDLYRVLQTARNLDLQAHTRPLIKEIKAHIFDRAPDAYALSLIWKNRTEHLHLTNFTIRHVCRHWLTGSLGDWDAVESYLEKAPGLKSEVVLEGQQKEFHYGKKKKDERYEKVPETKASVSKVNKWTAKVDHRNVEVDTTSWDWTQGNILQDIKPSPPASVCGGVSYRLSLWESLDYHYWVDETHLG
ncbi:hypothetical protein BU16DRAFT_576648 [Lophium mytilinum]|uniref:Uncharacterized protein n=1 Tax=Lophium mytilinum TaxID=390894 RepID=A0A6A6RD85_9PEZI|nr:hypothetical protein BU16DRAFT_576648 [Lophium mytilinum]